MTRRSLFALLGSVPFLGPLLQRATLPPPEVLRSLTSHVWKGAGGMWRVWQPTSIRTFGSVWDSPSLPAVANMLRNSHIYTAGWLGGPAPPGFAWKRVPAARLPELIRSGRHFIAIDRSVGALPKTLPSAAFRDAPVRVPSLAPK